MAVTYAKKMNGFGMDAIEKMFAAAVDPDLISFAGGAPAPELYPVDAFREASDKLMAEDAAAAMAYDSSPGLQPLRQLIAEDRMSHCGVQAGADDIRILSGSQQGIDFAARLFIEEGDVIICEDPSYLGALNTFNSYGAKYAPVPMDEEGMCMDGLEKALQENPHAKFIYTVPEFQNPTGITLSLTRRKQMMALAEQYQVPILEDSPYNAIRFSGDHLPAIKSFDTQGLVIYLGSFSKILSPGLRVGWVCASPEILKMFSKIKEASDLQASTMTQKQLMTFLKQHNLREHIETMAPFYQNRRDIALAAMKREFPANVSYTHPEGGFFTWVTLPEGVDATELFNRAVTEQKVAFVPGEPTFPNADKKNHMRLSYAQMTEEKINEGMKRLGELLHSL